MVQPSQDEDVSFFWFFLSFLHSFAGYKIQPLQESPVYIIFPPNHIKIRIPFIVTASELQVQCS